MKKIKKQKKSGNSSKMVKATLKKTVNLIIEDDVMFIPQIIRKDVLTNMLLNCQLSGPELFSLVMNENGANPSASRQGDLFETICEILISCKCIQGIEYSNIFCGDLSSLKTVNNINAFLKNKIHQGGNVSDVTIETDGCTIGFSIKYKGDLEKSNGKISKKSTDVSDLANSLKKISDSSKCALIVKDKKLIRQSKKNDVHDDALSEIVKNNLLFDSSDIIKGLDIFREKFGRYKNVNDLVEFVNAEYLGSSRKQLIKKLHQKMSELKFKCEFSKNTRLMWCIAHKPRSGKSITILLICKHLLENGSKRILIMTSVPATIKSFVESLEQYLDFKNIEYVQQDEFETVDAGFNGIVFCSTEYLKLDKSGKKKQILKNLSFNCIVADECHLGSSTDKTKSEILCLDDVEDLRKDIKLNIFASGTAEKTIQYYRIPRHCVDEWSIVDEGLMKGFEKNGGEVLEFMSKRHGPLFVECLQDATLNRDYSKHPTLVLMKYSLEESLISEIKEYNQNHLIESGFSFTSLLALRQTIGGNGEVRYSDDFDLCKDNDGISLVKGALDFMVSNNKMRDTIMKKIETTQTARGSRKSTVENPLLFLVYLPINTRNGTIELLQKAMLKFLKEHGMWSDYNIEYSNSNSDSLVDIDGMPSQDYNDFIPSIMKKTKKNGKRGCILLLGNKGGVGITYNDCDVSISLDDGHNFDNQQQRISRALTEAEGKTIGINVDMNVQRANLTTMSIVQKYQKTTKSPKSHAEILQYLFEHNIFLFDPQQINNGNIKKAEILRFYQTETENMMKHLDDEPFLENIVCNDDMRDFIKLNLTKIRSFAPIIDEGFEGENQDCPKGEKTKIQVDSLIAENSNVEECEEMNEEEKEKVEQLINQTYELCKSFLFPLLALISKSHKVFIFSDILYNQTTGPLLISLLKDKKIEVNNENITIIYNIMTNIINNNEEIVNNIREIYAKAPSHKLRDLIAKHFIPTEEERQRNGEVSTPAKIVDKMLVHSQNHVANGFWNSLQKTFDPCCGKGNIVLGLFDMHYNGLKNAIPDEIERCHKIVTECIYYADISALNVFITTELLKCHIQSYCGLDDIDWQFNSHVGDTLELNVEEKWPGVKLTEMFIACNPPYSTDPKKHESKPLYDKFIMKYIPAKYVLFIVPSRWFVGGKGLDTFRKDMLKRRDIVFIEHEDDSQKMFGKTVDIEGGINYFLKSDQHNGDCLFNGESYNLSKYDCIIKPKYHAIIDKVNALKSLAQLYAGRCFGIETNDEDRLKNTGSVKCYVSLKKSKDRCKYLDSYEFTEKNTFWKVITAEANGSAPNFGVKFIGKPNEVHTGSYISFKVKNEDEAKSLLSYLETKFTNHMLSIRKISQHINGDVCKWIPLVPLDKIWNDDLVCEYLNIQKTLYM